MTVAELIAELEKFPKHWAVQIPEINLSGMVIAGSVIKSDYRPDTVEIGE